MQKDRLALLFAIAMTISSSVVAIDPSNVPTISQANEVRENIKTVTREEIVSSLPATQLENALEEIRLEKEREEQERLEEQRRLEEEQRLRLEQERIAEEERIAKINSRKQELLFEISYYCSCYHCTQNGDKQTASGAYAVEGVTIACPSDVPFGSEVHIEGVGTFVNQDRGGYIQYSVDSEGRRVMRVDVYVESHSEALTKGRHYSTGYIYSAE